MSSWHVIRCITCQLDMSYTRCPKHVTVTCVTTCVTVTFVLCRAAVHFCVLLMTMLLRQCRCVHAIVIVWPSLSLFIWLTVLFDMCACLQLLALFVYVLWSICHHMFTHNNVWVIHVCCVYIQPHSQWLPYSTYNHTFVGSLAHLCTVTLLV